MDDDDDDDDGDGLVVIMVPVLLIYPAETDGNVAIITSICTRCTSESFLFCKKEHREWLRPANHLNAFVYQPLNYSSQIGMRSLSE